MTLNHVVMEHQVVMEHLCPAGDEQCHGCRKCQVTSHHSAALPGLSALTLEQNKLRLMLIKRETSGQEDRSGSCGQCLSAMGTKAVNQAPLITFLPSVPLLDQ